MRKQQDIINQIESHLDAIYIGAYEFIEQEARKMLRTHPNLDEFIMAMGSCFFTRKVGSKRANGTIVQSEADSNINSHEEPAYITNSRLMKFIEEYDSDLKFTGEPMRFTAYGPKTTNW